MAAYEHILLQEQGPLCILALNKPEIRNPLTEDAKKEFIDALDAIGPRHDVRALVVTGSGAAFCAGGDVKKIGQDLAPEEIREIMLQSQRLLKKLMGLEKPVIAAVNGDAFGMGCNLALAADFVVASERARFCEVFVKIGAIADFGALHVLPRLVGLWKSKELVYLGDVIDAKEAMRIGLIYRAVPHEELMDAALTLAGRLAAMPTRAIAGAKRILDSSYCMTLEEVLAEEIESQIALSRTEDYREGIQALLEKRKPTFQGK